MESDLKPDLEAICTNIQNPDRSIRQRGLKTLLFLTENSQTAADLFDHTYLYVLKCYGDKFESIRQLACDIITEMIPKLPATNDYYLGIIIPVIVRRCGQTEIIEDSEELRLVLVRQLHQLIEIFQLKLEISDQRSPFLHTYNDIIDILVKTLRDPYPNVQRECCGIVDTLAGSAVDVFHLRCHQLVQPLISMLNHKHSLNRVAALRALGTVCLHTQKSESIIQILASCSPLLMDKQPQVRLECGRIGCRWLLELRDRYSFFERILPLVFCCLKDEMSTVRDEIRPIWIKCGDQYYKENENELQRSELIDERPIKYPIGVERPTLGCRAIMQRSLRMINIILIEMVDWKEDVRLHSLKLLGQAVLHAEQALAVKFIEIYPILARSCQDSDPVVCDEAVRVAGLMGMLLECDGWIEHGIVGLEKSPCLGYMRCFATLYVGAVDNQKDKHIRQIVKSISNPSICHNLKSAYLGEFLKLLNELVDGYLRSEQPERELEKCLYDCCIKSAAFSFDNRDNQQLAMEIIHRLSRKSIPDLHSKHMEPLLNSIEDLDSSNSEFVEPILLLHGILTQCSFQKEYIRTMIRTVKTAVTHAQCGGKIKLFSGISIAIMKWKDQMSDLSITERIVELNELLKEIIEPNLIWGPGRNAESVRAMVTGVLVTIGEYASDEATILFPSLSVQFITLLDDHSPVTRAHTVRCIQYSGPIPIGPFESIMLGVLSRLDDPSSEVRELAMKCIGKIDLLSNGDGTDTDLDRWKQILKHVMKILFLHLDDPDMKLRPVLLDAISDITEKCKESFEEAYKGLPPSYPHRDILDGIKNLAI